MIAHHTKYKKLVELEADSGNTFLQRYLQRAPKHATYLGHCSVTDILTAISSWLFNKLLQSLQKSPVFAIMSDETTDITTTSQISICCRWLNVSTWIPEEHFLKLQNIPRPDAATIADALRDFMNEHSLEPATKCQGQGYDGCNTMAGNKSGVQKRIQETAAPFARYIHCRGHKIQLSLMHTMNANTPSSNWVRKQSSSMLSLWKLFNYSAVKTQKLREAEELLIGKHIAIPKPSTTRWLSYDRNYKAVTKALGPLYMAMEELATDDAEAYGVQQRMGKLGFVSTVNVLGKAHHALAQFQGAIQGKVISFTDVPRMITSLTEKLENVRDCVHDLVEEGKALFDKEITQKVGTELKGVDQQENIEKHLTTYLNKLIENIQQDFDESQHLFAALSLFDPNEVLHSDPALDRGKLDNLLDFYGSELSYTPASRDGDDHATIQLPPPVDAEKARERLGLFMESYRHEVAKWKQEKDCHHGHHGQASGTGEVPQAHASSAFDVETDRSADYLSGSEETDSGSEDDDDTEAAISPLFVPLYEAAQCILQNPTYQLLFPDLCKLLMIALVLPVTSVSNERSFSSLKMIKTRLRNALMLIAVEGPAKLTNEELVEILWYWSTGKRADRPQPIRRLRVLTKEEVKAHLPALQ